MEIKGAFWQTVIRYPLWYLFSYFGRLRVDGLENLEGLRGPLIVAANHKDYLDGFLIGAVLPRSSPLIPLRYMVSDVFFRNPATRIALKLLGTYPAYAKQGIEKSLAAPKRILRDGGVAAIFPEGKRIADTDIASARPGIAILALETDAPILPVAIRGGGKMNFVDFFRRAHRLNVIFGKPFSLRERVHTETSMYDAAQVVIKEIRSLYARIPEGVGNHQDMRRHQSMAQDFRAKNPE